ncbi:MAG: hypothetical protein LC624_09155 [Halobacteriales archaeon]|nr:hypothetical protein [Halobacteriales archaeon]
MLALRTLGVGLVAIGVLGVLAAGIGLLGLSGILPGLLLLGLTLPLVPVATSGLTGPTDRAQRLRISFGLLLWFAGAGLVVFGPSVGLAASVERAGLSIAALSGAVLALAGMGCLRPALTRQQRRQARERA